MSLVKSIWYGSVKDGKLILDNRPLFDTFLKSVKKEERVELILENITKDKTNQQLRYYYGMIVPAFSENTGYPKNEADGVLKRQFLTVHKGQPNEYVKNKRDLTLEEMSAFIDNAIMFCTSLGIFIPTPTY